MAEIFQARMTAERRATMSEDARLECACDGATDLEGKVFHLVVRQSTAKSIVVVEKPNAEEMCFAVAMANHADIARFHCDVGPDRAALFWGHVQRRGIDRVLFLIDADPCSTVTAATLVAAKPEGLPVDVRWVIASLIAIEPTAQFEIKLRPWERAFVESLSDAENSVLDRDVPSVITALWKSGKKIEVDGYVLWRVALVERVLNDALAR